jgi:hypothetical protein
LKAVVNVGIITFMEILKAIIALVIYLLYLLIGC